MIAKCTEEMNAAVLIHVQYIGSTETCIGVPTADFFSANCLEAGKFSSILYRSAQFMERMMVLSILAALRPGPACVQCILVLGMMHFVMLQHRQLCYCTRQFHALDPPGAEFVLASTETAEGQHCAALVVCGDPAPDTSCAPGQCPSCKCPQVGSVLVDRMASLLAPATEAGHQKT